MATPFEGVLSHMRRLASILIALVLTAAACNADRGDGGDASGDGGGDGGGVETEITLVGKDTAFDKTELTASAGSVTITFDNQDDGLTHNLHVSGAGVDEKTNIESGPKTQTLEVDLEPGTYTFVCDVHPQEMEGELVVS